MRASFLLLVLCLAPIVRAWDPWPGTVEPSWGAAGNPMETARPAPPAPWTSNTAGYYYVEPGGVNAGNGFPGSPRGSIPTLSAGDKVYLAGDFPSALTITASGTDAAPAWVTSYDTGAMAEWSAKVTISGSSSYLFLDSIQTDFQGSGNGKFEVAAGADHIMWRNIDLGGCAPRDGLSTSTSSDENQEGFAIFGASGNRTNNLIIYNCHLHHTGNKLYTSGVDPDAHIISFGLYVDDVLIDGNEMHGTSGNGLQIGAGTNGSESDTDASHRITVTRNTIYDTAQGGLWTKRAVDVFFFANTCHSARRDTGSTSPDSGGIGAQYDPTNMQIGFNTIYNCNCGIQIMGGGTGVRIFGNLVYDIHDDDGDLDASWRTDFDYQGGVAISLRGAAEADIVNNTIDDVDVGIACNNGAPDWTARIAGNVITNRNEAVAGGHIILRSDASSTITHNILSGTPYIQYGATAHTSIAALNAAKGPGNDGTAPTYTNAAARDYTLQAGSNGIDDFTSSAHTVYSDFFTAYSRSIQYDRAGTARPQNTNWDIGAYEFTSGGGGSSNLTTGNLNITGNLTVGGTP